MLIMSITTCITYSLSEVDGINLNSLVVTSGRPTFYNNIYNLEVIYLDNISSKGATYPYSIPITAVESKACCNIFLKTFKQFD